MNQDYPIKVKRSKRKTASIYIERDGSLSVLVPDMYSDQDVSALSKANEYKIFKYQAKRELLNEKAVKREAVNGQSFLYLGRTYYLQFDNKVGEIQFKGRYFYAPEGSAYKLKSMFKAFYRHRGIKYLAPKVMQYAEKMGVHVEEISVLDLKTRWGSCSVKKPKINFHWKVMMAPVSVIDYLIVHELTHLKHKRHYADFWNDVDKILPDYRKQIHWLKENGASLEL
jgi:hypothetical protein